MIRSTSGSRDWLITDTARYPSNLSGFDIAPNIAPTYESNSGYNAVVDVVSNGFKLRSSASPNYNGSSETYIYAAFAEAPF